MKTALEHVLERLAAVHAGKVIAGNFPRDRSVPDGFVTPKCIFDGIDAALDLEPIEVAIDAEDPRVFVVRVAGEVSRMRLARRSRTEELGKLTLNGREHDVRIEEFTPGGPCSGGAHGVVDKKPCRLLVTMLAGGAGMALRQASVHEESFVAITTSDGRMWSICRPLIATALSDDVIEVIALGASDHTIYSVSPAG